MVFLNENSDWYLLMKLSISQDGTIRLLVVCRRSYSADRMSFGYESMQLFVNVVTDDMWSEECHPSSIRARKRWEDLILKWRFMIIAIFGTQRSIYFHWVNADELWIVILGRRKKDVIGLGPGRRTGWMESRIFVWRVS